MADRQTVQHTLNNLLHKLDDPDPDMRYMSLNDLLGLLDNPNSSYLAHDPVSASKLAEGLLKALDDQHGDVQNQALKCLGPLVHRLPFENLASILEKLTNLTASQTIDTSVPNTALRYIVTALPRPQAGQTPSQEATSAYSAVSRVLIPRLTGPIPSPSSRRGSVVKGMLEKDPSKGFSSDAIDVLIQVVTCFGPLLQEAELTALQNSVMSIVDNDTAGTVVTKRALAAISALVLHFSDHQLNLFVKDLTKKFKSQPTTIHQRHLVATVGSIAKSAPAKFGPYLPTLAPFVFSALGEDAVAPLWTSWITIPSMKIMASYLLSDLAHLCKVITLSSYFIPHLQHLIFHTRLLSCCITLHLSLRIHFTSFRVGTMRMLNWALPFWGLAACTTARNIITLQSSHQVSPILHRPQDDVSIQPLAGRAPAGIRCGSGVGKCPEKLCCSTADSKDHCSSPDCQIDYGYCDAHMTPGGSSTEDIPRPLDGTALYGPHIIRSCTVPGTVALTFDDGPKEFTKDLLDLLDRYEAKATFFITGNNNAKGQIDSPGMPWAGLIRRMHESGHQLASHTWSHQDLSKISRSQRRIQLLWNEAALRNILGFFPTYMRPPYSSCTAESGCLADMGELGYHIVLYDIDTEDYKHDSPTEIQRSKDIFDSSLDARTAFDRPWLVIAHDVHEQTVYNLTEHMLKKLIAEGFRPVTVGECLGDSPKYWYREDNTVDGRNSRKNVFQDSSKIVSFDGMCGGNITCDGSRFGPCCSGTGFCGNLTTFCGEGCQNDNGICDRKKDVVVAEEDHADFRPSSKVISKGKPAKSGASRMLQPSRFPIELAVLPLLALLMG
ncbi:glycoside hydrolase/deacetylase [Aspergillus violaceofuscus CBS 115571]|uniref:Glycoside hydrolase/deacetylase n=1 Tax=Aspergillus violaceofuscus (strain CBS 115571) TaxID=1450538 RepID=A0A2V5H7Y6_ASPV1|nr:glycoside hydrolase/deacetylase [Aspergillus violaceofuscus CBS 115571]